MGIVVMPDPPVPSSRLDPRHDPDADRASCMVDIDFGADTLAEMKRVDPDSIGTAIDDAGVTTDIHQQVKREDPT